MRIEATSLPLTLKAPFRISHGTTRSRTNLLVRVAEGLGEAGLPPYLGVDVASAQAWLESVQLPAWNSQTPPPVAGWLAALPSGPAAARCALDLALHDLWGKRLGQPLYRLWGLDPASAPPTFRTISIPDDVDAIVAASLPASPLLKVKVGTGDPNLDVRIVQRVRELSDSALCVDANGAWSIPDAVRVLPRIRELGVLFVEQPIAAGDPEDWHLLARLVTRNHRPPIVADESVRNVDDVIALAGAADGINLKLAKCGGLAATRHLIALGRALDMSITLGCMIESSLAITAASHLASLADHVDLDGADFLDADPYQGATIRDGVQVPPDLPGLGVTPRIQ